MKIQDTIKKVNKDQFIIDNSIFYKDNKPFAITESTPETFKYKVISIDFEKGNYRAIDLDWLLLILTEFYGKDFLVKAITEIKNYDSVKDIEIPKELLNKIKIERKLDNE
jgi:hypothetical protein